MLYMHTGYKRYRMKRKSPSLPVPQPLDPFPGSNAVISFLSILPNIFSIYSFNTHTNML